MNYLVCFNYTNILADQHLNMHEASSTNPVVKPAWVRDLGCLAVRGLPGQGKRLMVMSVTPCLLGHEVAGKQARTDYSVPTALKGGASGGICFLAWCNRSCCTWEGSV